MDLSKDLFLRELVSIEQWPPWQAWQREAGLRQLERSLQVAELQPFLVAGTCHVCSGPRRFEVEWSYSYEVDGVLTPNWREHLLCPSCGLNNRMRAAIHLAARLGLRTDSNLYLTEALTPLASVLKRRCGSLHTSEFLSDGTPAGRSNDGGVRHEDLTDLTFEASSFDGVLSFDVLEHIPDYRTAFAECFRVLRPGGVLLFTVPFRPDLLEHHDLARMGPDGAIEHLQEPEYHADPVTGEGCLCFRHFGWLTLAELAEIGFEDNCVLAYWSREFGYLGGNGLILRARRPA